MFFKLFFCLLEIREKKYFSLSANYFFLIPHVAMTFLGIAEELVFLPTQSRRLTRILGKAVVFASTLSKSEK